MGLNMTICIFDGKNLVADRRRTNKANEEQHTRYSESRKIITYTNDIEDPVIYGGDNFHLCRS
jgi:hypothetical protein